MSNNKYTSDFLFATSDNSNKKEVEQARWEELQTNGFKGNENDWTLSDLIKSNEFNKLFNKIGYEFSKVENGFDYEADKRAELTSDLNTKISSNTANITANATALNNFKTFVSSNYATVSFVQGLNSQQTTLINNLQNDLNNQVNTLTTEINNAKQNLGNLDVNTQINNYFTNENNIDRNLNLALGNLQWNKNETINNHIANLNYKINLQETSWSLLLNTKIMQGQNSFTIIDNKQLISFDSQGELLDSSIKKYIDDKINNLVLNGNFILKKIATNFKTLGKGDNANIFLSNFNKNDILFLKVSGFSMENRENIFSSILPIYLNETNNASPLNFYCFPLLDKNFDVNNDDLDYYRGNFLVLATRLNNDNYIQVFYAGISGFGNTSTINSFNDYRIKKLEIYKVVINIQNNN